MPVQPAEVSKKVTAAPAADATAQPALNRDELAAQYGWAMAVLKHNPELSSLFDQAVKETWTPAKFTAEVRNTKWYQTTTANQRSNQILKDTDPTEYKRRFNEQLGTITSVSGTMGAALGTAKLRDIASHAMTFGWSADEIRRNVADAVDWGSTISNDGAVNGTAAEIAGDVRKVGAAYGIKVSDHFVANAVDNILQDKGTKDGYVEYFKNAAKQTYSAYASQIDAGHTVDEIAEPFRQSMANILEVDPGSITLTDDKIRKALTARDDKGLPTFTPIWQFENQLREDPRWQSTDNARSTYSGLTASIGKMFGKM